MKQANERGSQTTTTPTRLSGRSTGPRSSGAGETPQRTGSPAEPPALFSPSATIDSERSVIIVDNSPAGASASKKSALGHVLAKNAPGDHSQLARRVRCGPLTAASQ